MKTYTAETWKKGCKTLYIHSRQYLIMLPCLEELGKAPLLSWQAAGKEKSFEEISPEYGTPLRRESICFLSTDCSAKTTLLGTGQADGREEDLPTPAVDEDGLTHQGFGYPGSPPSRVKEAQRSQGIQGKGAIGERG